MGIKSLGFQVYFTDEDQEYISNDGEDLSSQLFLEVFTIPVEYKKALKEYHDLKKLFPTVRLVQVWKE